MAPGYTTELLTFLIATDLEINPLTAEDTEEIDVVIVSLDEALEMVQNRTIVDAKTVMGIFLYQKWIHAKLF
jgi:ADP-ribose pyrophosphatase